MPGFTVLIVDDHALVLRTLVCTLSRARFEVLSAASGEEALEIASETEKGIDLLICDIILPGIPGSELAEEVAAIHPETRVLFITGWPDQNGTAGELPDPDMEVLAKPFLPEVLLRKVRTILGHSSGLPAASVA